MNETKQKEFASTLVERLNELKEMYSEVGKGKEVNWGNFQVIATAKLLAIESSTLPHPSKL